MSTIAIIGGGIVGSSTAYHLTKAGIQTILIDNEEAGRATSAGAGIVAPGTSLRPLPSFFDLAGPAVSYYPELVAQLVDLGLTDTGYEVCGKLLVADTQEKAEKHPELKALFEQRRASGMPNLDEISVLTPSEAKKILPTLGDMYAAMYISGAARVDGAKLRDALTQGAQELGARIIRGTAIIDVSGDHVTGIRVGDESIPVDAVVVSAGAWTNKVLAPTGFTMGIAPQKGQIIHIDMPNQNTAHWPILDWSGSQYQLCFGPNRVVCGATREFGSGYDTRITPAGVKLILDEQLRICPGLAEGTIAEIRVGLRPYAGDALPFIDTVPGYHNIVVSSGHGPSGLQLGPFSGLLASELAQGLQPTTDINDFRIDRPIEPLEIV